MADININQTFSPAEATRGQFAPIDMSTMSEEYPSAGRGRYAQFSYIMGSEPGALSLALSGGNVILPVSSVSIDEPVSTTELLTNTTIYSTTSVAATSLVTINFASNISHLEVYNNDSSLPIYLGFNSVSLQVLSAQAFPIVAESFYAIDRETSTIYLGNVDTSSSVDVRIAGHHRV